MTVYVGTILDDIIRQEQDAFALRQRLAAEAANLCKLTVAVDDARNTSLAAIVTFTENKDGSVTVALTESGPIKGDVRALYLSFADGFNVKGLTYSSPDNAITGMQVSSGETLTSLSADSSTNMNGATLKTAGKGFDAGFLVGNSSGLSAGGKADDYTAFSFVIRMADGSRIDVSQISEIGVRAMSVGDAVLGTRTLSEKAVETIDKGACFELEDSISRVTETQVVGNKATGNVLDAARAADPDPLSRYAIASFTVDGRTYAVGDSVAFGDPRLGLTFTMRADGSWAITGPGVDGLSAGQFPTLLVSFTATKAGADATTTATATADAIFGVVGENDAPTAAAASIDLAEDTIASGRVSFGDIDLYDRAQVTGVSFGGTIYGLDKAFALDSRSTIFMTMHADGSYTIDAENADYLAAGEIFATKVQYLVGDGHGGTAMADIDITVTGSADGPTATAVIRETAEDAAALQINLKDYAQGTGELTFSLGSPTYRFYDFNGSEFPVSRLKNVQELLSFDAATGMITWNSESPIADQLPAGTVLEVTGEYTVSDSYGTATSTYRLLMAGVDDLPVADAVSLTVPESFDGILTRRFTVATDADIFDRPDIQIHSVSYQLYDASGAPIDVPETSPLWRAVNDGGTDFFQVFPPAPGTIDVRYNSVLEFLGEGQRLNLVATYFVMGTNVSNTVTLDVIGQNDGPRAFSATASLSENEAAYGRVNFSDRDIGDKVGVTGISFNGHTAAAGEALALDEQGKILMTIDAVGNYTVDAINADHLAAGEAFNAMVRYEVNDGHGGTAAANINVNVWGTNDDPFADAATVDLAEDFVAQGKVSFGDVDHGALVEVTGISFDGRTAAVGEALALDANGTILMTIDAAGNYSINAVDADWLGEGETFNATVQYQVTDDQGAMATADINITVTGSVDGPTARAVAAETLEDAEALQINLNDYATGTGPLEFSLGAFSTKYFFNDVLVGRTAGLGNIGSLVVALDPATGALSLNSQHDFLDKLSVGLVAQISGSYTVWDAAGNPATSTYTFRINGVNDDPIANTINIGGPEQDAVMEDTVVSGNFDGQGYYGDPDVYPNMKGSLFTKSDIAGFSYNGRAIAFGETFALDANGTIMMTMNRDVEYAGSRTYTIDALNADWLREGETFNATLQYTVVDDFGATVTADINVTVTGTADGPTAEAVTGATEEDTAALQVNLNNYAQGIGALTFSLVGNTTYRLFAADGTEISADLLKDTVGLLTFDAATGILSWNGEAAGADALAAGMKLVAEGEYAVEDAGGTATSTYRFEMIGRNDAPTATSDWTTLIVGESAAGHLFFQDADIGDTAQVTKVALNYFDTGAVNAGEPIFDPGYSAGQTPWTMVVNSDGAYTIHTEDHQNIYLNTWMPAYTVTDTQGASAKGIFGLTLHGPGSYSEPAPEERLDAVGDTVSPTSLRMRGFLAEFMANDYNPTGSAVIDTIYTHEQGFPVWALSPPRPGSLSTWTMPTAAGGSITFRFDGSYEYVAPTNGALTDFFSYSIKDHTGLTDTAVVTINIPTPPPGYVAPTAHEVIGETREDAPAVGFNLSEYASGRGLTFSLLGNTTYALYNADGVKQPNALLNQISKAGLIALDPVTGIISLNGEAPGADRLPEGWKLTMTGQYAAEDSFGAQAVSTYAFDMIGVDDPFTVNSDQHADVFDAEFFFSGFNKRFALASDADLGGVSVQATSITFQVYDSAGNLIEVPEDNPAAGYLQYPVEYGLIQFSGGDMRLFGYNYRYLVGEGAHMNISVDFTATAGSSATPGHIDINYIGTNNAPTVNGMISVDVAEGAEQVVRNMNSLIWDDIGDTHTFTPREVVSGGGPATANEYVLVINNQIVDRGAEGTIEGIDTAGVLSIDYDTGEIVMNGGTAGMEALGAGMYLAVQGYVTVADQFGWEATNGGSNIYHFKVSGANDGPDAVNDNLTVAANGRAAGFIRDWLVNDMDIDYGDSVSFAGINGRAFTLEYLEDNDATLAFSDANGSRLVVFFDGHYEFTAGITANGTLAREATFTYAIADEHGSADEASVIFGLLAGT